MKLCEMKRIEITVNRPEISLLFSRPAGVKVKRKELLPVTLSGKVSNYIWLEYYFLSCEELIIGCISGDKISERLGAFANTQLRIDQKLMRSAIKMLCKYASVSYLRLDDHIHHFSCKGCFLR
jgi:hypothetical protein